MLCQLSKCSNFLKGHPVFYKVKIILYLRARNSITHLTLTIAIQKWEGLCIFTYCIDYYCCTFQTKVGHGDDGFTSITESDSEFKTMTSENSMFETAQSGAVNARATV